MIVSIILVVVLLASKPDDALDLLAQISLIAALSVDVAGYCRGAHARGRIARGWWSTRYEQQRIREGMGGSCGRGYAGHAGLRAGICGSGGYAGMNAGIMPA